MTNQSGKWKVELTKQKAQNLTVYQPLLGRWTGFLGRNDGVVQNPGYPVGYVYVRGHDGSLMTMWNQHVPNIADLPIIYGYVAEEPKLLQVITQWTTYVSQPVANLPSHGLTHEWPNSDTVWIHGEQFLPWLVRPNASNPYAIDIFPGLERVGGIWVFSSSVTVDLTAHVPASGARFVIVCLKSDDTFTVVDGSTVGTPEVLGASDIPSEPAGTVVKAIVRLYTGQASIRQTLDVTDIFDPRFATGGGGGGNDMDLYWVITPPQITGNLNDWTPTGYDATTRVIEVSSDAPHNITGLTGGSAILPERRLVLFYNIGGNPITFQDENGGSAAANQFWNQIDGAVDVTIAPGHLIQYQYDPILSLWVETMKGVPSDLLLNKVVLVDSLGKESVVDFFSFRPDFKQIIFGSNEVGIPGAGGTAFHIIDETGFTGGEIFMWAFGVGTGHGGFPDSDFCGRYWMVRGGGTESNPTGVLDQWELGEIIGFGFGDNGQYNATGEPGQAEETNRIKIAFRAVGDWTDTSRATQMEFWVVPTGSLLRSLALTIQQDGGLNLGPGGYITVDGDPFKPRPVSETLVTAAAIAPDCADDIFAISALASALTINPPVSTVIPLMQGLKLMIRIKDDGLGPYALTWDGIYRMIGTTLPVVTVSNKTVYVSLVYNSDDTTWDCILVSQEV